MKKTARTDNTAGAGLKGAAAGPRQTAAPPVGTADLTRNFALALERQGRDTAVLLLAGELDLYRAPDIEMALAEAIGLDSDNGGRQSLPDGQPAQGGEIAAEEVRHLVVDLRSVTFIDSTTLALLLVASRHQQARGADLLILVGPQTPMTAFQVTGFDRLLTIRHGDDHRREGLAILPPAEPRNAPAARSSAWEASPLLAPRPQALRLRAGALRVTQSTDDPVRHPRTRHPTEGDQ